MTLTEFLLARIAEDEADVPTLGYTMHLTPERRLAECEAKRRIVELHRQMYPRNSRYLPNCEGCWEEPPPQRVEQPQWVARSWTKAASW